MKGTEWRALTRANERALQEIPMEYTATMPLPVADGRRAAVCWHYCAQPAAEADFLIYQPPGLVTLWDTEGNLLETRWLREEPEQETPAAGFLNTGAAERAYMDGPFTAWLEGADTDIGALKKAWRATLPAPVAEYIGDKDDWTGGVGV